MKKVTKVITKQVEEAVYVCDTCEQEKPLPITWTWSITCTWDSCVDDFGNCHFCSVACFHAGLAKALEHLDAEEDHLWQQFQITVDSFEVHDEMNNLLNLLAEAAGKAPVA